MVKITELPAQKLPKLLTAHRPITSLGEHMLAFLNANNPKGFKEEDFTWLKEEKKPKAFQTAPSGETEEDETIEKVLLDLVMRPVVTRSQITGCARRIKEMTNRAIHHSKAMNILAVALGYQSSKEVTAIYSVKGFVPNLRQQEAAIVFVQDIQEAASITLAGVTPNAQLYPQNEMHDRLLTFLNAHYAASGKVGGFSVKELLWFNEEAITTIFIAAHERESFTRSSMQVYKERIRKLSNREISTYRAREMLAALIGYSNSKAVSVKHQAIPNLRIHEAF